ncbi:hypothetical protein J2S20_001707 [Moryella indoligenes]|uniref:Uncharacterized protein n=1 Tax=Moryella indoligenes TaxID=371674 RepID=A0AAE3VAZ2_9FIRM|nr:hypothetical protein [Moryella indoligenes]
MVGRQNSKVIAKPFSACISIKPSLIDNIVITITLLYIFGKHRVSKSRIKNFTHRNYKIVREIIPFREVV